MPVEGMRHVDEPALFADRRDRVGEAEAAWDLALEEEPDHLALFVRLHLLAGNDDQLSTRRVVGGLQCAAEDVVVGDRDRAQPLCLGVVDELGRIDRAVVRPRGVHVQVGHDQRAVAERVCVLTAPSAHRQAAVEIGELRGNDGEVVCLGLGPGLRAFPLAQRIVLGEPSRGCRRELRLRLDSVRSCDRTSCGRRFEA